MTSIMITVTIQLVDWAGSRNVIAIPKTIMMTAVLMRSNSFMVENFIAFPQFDNADYSRLSLFLFCSLCRFNCR